ncbi:DUF6266 family protein [Odoribacter lunatus]|uniref:DUF6266 family protein n=1 Tax=Odoribacter lunatus TaxID=2941335 RepID=UPI00203B4648|nr:DUF6266 family protein [Odoribacter lunatus]
MIITEEIPFLGCCLGTIDNLIVYRYRNRRCIRRKPSKVKPPSAPGQVAQQERMASIAIFYQALKEVGIYTYWQRAAEGMLLNGYNLLVKGNLPAFSGDGRICDFSKLRLTTGALALPDGLRVSRVEEGMWTVAWENTPNQVNASPDDRLQLYVMRDSETFAVKLLACGEVRRCDGRVSFRLPEELREYSHLYVAFCSHTEKRCSESKYFSLILKSIDYGSL